MQYEFYRTRFASRRIAWSVGEFQTASSGIENPKVLASPVVYGGRVYIGNESATVYCLNAGATSTAGECIWSYTFDRDDNWPDRTGVSSVAIGPTASGEMRAFVGCDNGHLYCLSIADSPTARRIWQYPAGDDEGIGCVESSPAVYAGNVYVGSSWFSDGTRPEMFALRAESGNLVWSKSHREEARATFAAADGAVFEGVDTGHEFFRLAADTGDPYPDSPSSNPFDASKLENQPSPAGSARYFVGSAAIDPAGFCLVGNDNYAMYTLSSLNLARQRTFSLGGVVCTSPAISYAAEPNCRWVYVLARPGMLYAFRQVL